MTRDGNGTAASFAQTLVLGGARSGKSRHGQGLAEASGLDLVFVATAEAHDGEMASRIARHAAARDARWRLVEAPFDLAAAIAAEARPDRLLLIDCATLWLSNVMLRGDDVEGACAGLVRAVAAASGPLIVISNEVGGGIVPESRLGRAFRDAQVHLNQMLAAACETVVLVVAGLPLHLKGAGAASSLGGAAPSHRELTEVPDSAS
jgi:adenosylcobinamide kinase/adenosylcobinamide-phosphate guanylyltransferase